MTATSPTSGENITGDQKLGVAAHARRAITAKVSDCGPTIILYRGDVIIGRVVKSFDGWRSTVNSVGHRNSRVADADPEAAAMRRWGSRGRDAVRYAAIAKAEGSRAS